ncbi:MAG: pyridoxal-dependent decarboxylase [Bacteroidota bacterium]|nr:pyridoxal-dependent decarboxylase [Bacteroidota bacterium]
MSRKTDHHMTPDEFRQFGKQVVDWIADYYEWVESQPVLPSVEPGDIRSRLPSTPPEKGEAFEDILADVDEHIVPGLTHWQSPNFMAYFPSNTSFPSILGEMMAAAMGQQGMMWKTSPVSTELETHVMDWLVDLLGLPESYRGNGVIQDTASSATLCAMLAAREQVTGGAGNRTGIPDTLVGYTSDQAHSSIQKAARIAGIGDERMRLLPTDDHFRIDTQALADAIRADRAAGLTPFFVCAAVGTTPSLAVDPVAEVVRAADGCWVHVDAAMAGTAALCEEFRWIHDGVEAADSYCFNPHKWMFTNFDCNAFWVRDRKALLDALSILPEYLRTAEYESGAAIDYRDWQIPLGRRFRALKLWFVLRHYGAEGLRHHVREHIRLAQSFEAKVQAHPDFELVVPRNLNLICFAHRRGDAFSERLMTAVNSTGRLYLSHAKLGDRYTIRVSIGGRDQQQRHIDAAWNLIVQTAAGLEA